VFVSYSTRDVEWANHLKRVLAETAASVFVAEHDVTPGTSLSSKISAEIKACDLFLLLWSSGSRVSSYVQSEVFLARAEKRRILPILLEAGLQLPPILGDLKYLLLDKTPQAALAWLRKHVSSYADEKAISDLIVLGVWGFIGWAIYHGSK